VQINYTQEMNIKRSIQFRLEQRKKNGVAVTENIPIRMRVTFAGTRIEFSTGYRIDEAKWDAEQQKVKKGCSNKQKQSYAEINASLSKYETVIQDIFKEYEVADQMPTSDDLKSAFATRTQAQNVSKSDDVKAEAQEDVKSFFDVFDEFVKVVGMQNTWTEASFEKFNALRNKLEEFCKSITFDDFDDNGFARFIDFLLTKKEMRNSTVSKNIDFLKMFLRWSYNKGYNTNNTFETYKFKLKTPPRKVIFLTAEELKQLVDLEIPETKKYLERVRDVFVFMCFTGLRHSDAYNLHRSDIKGDHIEITTIKTHDSLIIELNKYSKAILDKYKDVPYKDDKALPVITNQKMNEYVKELAKMAGINEPIRMIHYEGQTRIENVYPKYELIGTHAARRTFVCSALALGIPAQVVMKWTGHNDYKAMKPYIDIADDIRAKSMKKFNQMDNLL
jgi:integrase